MRGEALAHAKLNWDLRVLGRRPDGFHELRTWFVAVAYADVLTAEPVRAGGSRLWVEGDAAAGVPTDGSNLVLRAESAWRAAFPAHARAVPPLEWRLEKRIPHGAGLGGGSSNAAAALALLDRFAGGASDPARLHAVAAALGSDVPFFLSHDGRAELRGGRGEILLARAPIAPHRIWIAWPHFPLATPAVYAALQAPAWDGLAPPAPPAPGAEPGPNQLEPAARRVAPQWAAWADAVFGARPRTLCGSGSAAFALRAPTEDAETAAWLAPQLPQCAGTILADLMSGPALRIRMEA